MRFGLCEEQSSPPASWCCDSRCPHGSIDPMKAVVATASLPVTTRVVRASDPLSFINIILRIARPVTASQSVTRQSPSTCYPPQMSVIRSHSATFPRAACSRMRERSAARGWVGGRRPQRVAYRREGGRDTKEARNGSAPAAGAAAPAAPVGDEQGGADGAGVGGGVAGAAGFDL